jgi:hypothetical protein
LRPGIGNVRKLQRKLWAAAKHPRVGVCGRLPPCGFGDVLWVSAWERVRNRGHGDPLHVLDTELSARGVGELVRYADDGVVL